MTGIIHKKCQTLVLCLGYCRFNMACWKRARSHSENRAHSQPIITVSGDSILINDITFLLKDPSKSHLTLDQTNLTDI